VSVKPTRLAVHRLVTGLDGRVPLVLLHGFTGDSTTWDRLVPHLGPDRPVLAVDLVGHGQSEAPADSRAYTVAKTVSSVRHALRAAGLVRAHWLGYSMGGRVALHMAITVPGAVSSLVLVGTTPGIQDPAERRQRRRDDEAWAASLEREGLAAFVDRWMARPLFATQQRLGQAYLAATRAQRMTNRPHALAHTLRHMGTAVMRSLWPRLHDLTAPVLLVNGAEDARFDGVAAAMALRLPSAQRLVVRGSGHAVHVEAPAALAARVQDFLRGLGGE